MHSKTYQQFIEESFNTRPAKWTNTYPDTEKDALYRFSIGIYDYKVEMDYLFYRNGYLVSFQILNAPGKLGGTYSTTGTGNEYQVLLTVIDCIRDRIEQRAKIGNPVDFLTFTAAKYKEGTEYLVTPRKSARSGVYKRLAMKFLPNTYSVEVIDRDDFTQFRITRNGVDFD